MNPIERFLNSVHEYRDGERFDTEHNDAYDVERPRVDIKETKSAFIAILDIPGAKKDEITVDISPNNVLSISAQRIMDSSSSVKPSPVLQIVSPVKLFKDVISTPESPSSAVDGTVKWHIHERRAPNYARSFRLPSTIIRDAVKAKYVDGTLTITIPKTEGTRAADILKVNVE